MIFFLGMMTKTKKEQYLGMRYCPQCERFQHFYLFTQKPTFSLFFLPIIQWTSGWYSGCSVCHYGKAVSKVEAFALKQDYADFITEQQAQTIFDFCYDMAMHQENTPENKEKLFSQVRERFDLKGHDLDFKKLIFNIFAVQEAARHQPHIWE